MRLTHTPAIFNLNDVKFQFRDIKVAQLSWYPSLYNSTEFVFLFWSLFTERGGFCVGRHFRGIRSIRSISNLLGLGSFFFFFFEVLCGIIWLALLGIFFPSILSGIFLDIPSDTVVVIVDECRHILLDVGVAGLWLSGLGGEDFAVVFWNNLGGSLWNNLGGSLWNNLLGAGRVRKARTALQLQRSIGLFDAVAEVQRRFVLAADVEDLQR